MDLKPCSPRVPRSGTCLCPDATPCNRDTAGTHDSPAPSGNKRYRGLDAPVRAPNLALTINIRSPAFVLRKLIVVRPSPCGRICDATLHPTTSYPAGSTTLFLLIPSERLKTIVFPSR